MNAVNMEDTVNSVIKSSNIGVWIIEIEDGREPRMYGNEAMMRLICAEEGMTPEEVYKTWYDNIYPDAYKDVSEAVRRMISGQRAETRYPWRDKNRGLIKVRCGGSRNFDYSDYVRLEGYHQDITSDKEDISSEAVAFDRKTIGQSFRISSSIISGLAHVFYNLYFVDLESNTFAIIENNSNYEDIFWDKGRASDALEYAVDNLVEAEFRPAMRQFVKLETVSDRIGSMKMITMDYKHVKYGWSRCCMIVAERDSLGRITKILCGNRGIAEEVRTKDELEEARTVVKEFSNIHETMGSGRWQFFYDHAGILNSVKWSDELRRILGYIDKDDFPDSFDNWMDKIHPDDREAVLRTYRKVLAETYGGARMDVEYRMKTRGDTYIWIRMAGHVRRRNDGTPSTMFGVCINSDEKHRAAEELRKQRGLLYLRLNVINAISKIYRSVSVVDIPADSLAEVQSMEYVHDIYGAAKHGAQNRINQMIQEQVVPEHQMAMLQFSDISTWESRFMERDSDYIECVDKISGWTRANLIVAQRDNRGKLTHVIFAIQEINDQKKAELDMQEALIRAEAANRAKTTFLSNMSHDIRTPMNAIMGFTRRALEHFDEREEIKNSLQKIATSSEHLMSLINDVLDMSRIESGNMKLQTEGIHLPDVMRDIVTITQSNVEKGQLHFGMSIVNLRDPDVISDRLRLTQILVNILGNATKFTKPGGNVNVVLTQLEGEDPGYGLYEFKLSDTGIGMSPQFVEHIFEEFSRERTSTVSGIQGTGLGMAITKSIVDAMQGTITVDSKEGVGTTFTVRLRLMLSKVAVRRKAPGGRKQVDNSSFAGELGLEGRQILLVEDNKLNQEIACGIVEEFGFSVDVADDGDIAVEKVAGARKDQYIMVLMDIQMPRMNGYESTRQIRRLENSQLADIPIVAMTANAFEEDKRAAAEAGMNGHVSKPIVVDQLRETMRQVLLER